jgi:hypothetical protein
MADATVIFRPKLTARIPPGWLPRETIQLAWPERSAYVVASTDAVAEGTTPEELAGQFDRALAEGLPGYEELSRESVQLPGVGSAVVRRSRWTPRGGDAVAELQMYVVADGMGIVSTARVPEASFAELEPRLHEVLAGIGIERQGAAGGGILRQDGSAKSRTYAALEAGRLTTSPAAAFGLESTNGDEAETASDQARAAWNDARSSWQRQQEEL